MNADVDHEISCIQGNESTGNKLNSLVLIFPPRKVNREDNVVVQIKFIDLLGNCNQNGNGITCSSVFFPNCKDLHAGLLL